MDKDFNLEADIMRRVWDMSARQHGGTEEQFSKILLASGLQVSCLSCKGEGGFALESPDCEPCDDCGGAGTQAPTDDVFTFAIEQEYGYAYYIWTVSGYIMDQLEAEVERVIKDPNYCWCGGPSGNALEGIGSWEEVSYERFYDTIYSGVDAYGHFHTEDDSCFKLT